MPYQSSQTFPYRNTKVDRLFTFSKLFSDKQVRANAQASAERKKRADEGAQSSDQLAPRDGINASILILPTKTKNRDAFNLLVDGLVEKMIRGATDKYTSGLKPVYWRGPGGLKTTGYDIVELRNAIEVQANNLLRKKQYCAKVSVKRHPQQDRIVLKFKIVKITPR